MTEFRFTGVKVSRPHNVVFFTINEAAQNLCIEVAVFMEAHVEFIAVCAIKQGALSLSVMRSLSFSPVQQLMRLVS
jgi:hypothetical protein